jgi:hypothetical protein
MFYLGLWFIQNCDGILLGHYGKGRSGVEICVFITKAVKFLIKLHECTATFALSTQVAARAKAKPSQSPHNRKRAARVSRQIIDAIGRRSGSKP